MFFVAFSVTARCSLLARCMYAHLRLLLLGLLLLATAVAKEVKGAKPEIYAHIFPASDTPLLKTALEADIAGKKALKTLQKYYEDMDEKLRASSMDDDYDGLEDTNVVNFLRLYGWPEMNETQMVFKTAEQRDRNDAARYRKEYKEFAASETRVFRALVALGRALESPVGTQSVKAFIADRNVTQWDRVFGSGRANYTTREETHKCSIRSNLAFRVDGAWFIHVSVTNDHPAVFKREGERVYLREVYRFSKSTGDIEFLPFMLDINFQPKLKYWGGRPYSEGSKDTFSVSSVCAEFGGPADVRFFISRRLEDNIALRAALADSDVLIRQVLDSQMWSNTAILLFPLLLSLVPLALFADPSDLLLLGYTMFTDFLSVLPLFIKGCELITAGQREYFSTRTLIRGTPKFVKGTLVASTWSCRCEAAGNITAYGAVFVAIAVVAAVTGVVLEFTFKNKVEANKLIAKKKFPQLSSTAECVWDHGGPCIQCDCRERPIVQPSSASIPSIGGGLIEQIRHRKKEERQCSIYHSLGTGL